MRAIILAAGVGRRLEAAGQAGPKCLLEFDGVTLLARHLRTLGTLGIDDVRICVGFQRDMIESVVADTQYTGHVDTVFNPDFTEGSAVSLWTMRDELRYRGDVILMDADVLYAPAILERLVVSPIANCFLLDHAFEPGPEPVKLCLRGDRIVEFSKTPDPAIACDDCGESVGFFRLDSQMSAQLAGRIERFIETGRRDAPYEDALRELLLETPERFGYEDITGLPWIEIDFPGDISRARSQIMPAIHGR